MKIIQFQIGPDNSIYQSAIFGLGDDGSIYTLDDRNGEWIKWGSHE